MAFRDLSENRIIIKKQDKTSFTNEEYEEIKNLSNVDYIVEDDLFLDGGITLYKDNMGMYGNIYSIENFRGKIDIGRMPENEDEIIIQVSKEHYYIKNRLEEVLNKSFSLSDFNGAYKSGEESKKVTIVGIKYNEDSNDYNAKFSPSIF